MHFEGPWLETMSRRFHSVDANSDGRVTRKEFETFFRGKDEEMERHRNQADNFFKQLVGFLNFQKAFVVQYIHM